MLNDNFNEFVRSKDAPLDIEIGSDLLRVRDAIFESEALRERQCHGGFFYGGLFTSLMRGEQPRDVDICIHAPEKVELATTYMRVRDTEAASFSEAQDRREHLEMIEYSLFPFSQALMYNTDDFNKIQDCPVIGPCFQVLGTTIRPNGGMQTVDMLFTKDAVDPLSFFLRRESAPIMQAAFDFESGEYVYHRDFPEHARQWLFEPAKPEEVSKDMVEKAREKGMTIVI